MLNKIVFVTFLFRLITYLLEKISTRNYRELSLPLLFHFPQTLFHENSSPPRCDWSRRLAPLSQLIRRKTKTINIGSTNDPLIDITCLLDIVLILYSEILSKSLIRLHMQLLVIVTTKTQTLFRRTTCKILF